MSRAVNELDAISRRRRLQNCDTVLDQLFAQGVAIEAQDPCRMNLVAACAFERQLDQRPLHFRDDTLIKVAWIVVSSSNSVTRIEIRSRQRASFSARTSVR